MNEHLTFILTEMCNRVGANFTEINFKEENWFQKYEWAEQEDNNFIDWVADYMYSNSAARKELMSITSKNKKMCNRFSREFCMNYTWKIKR